MKRSSEKSPKKKVVKEYMPIKKVISEAKNIDRYSGSISIDPE